MPTISLEQALRNAIEAEDASHRFYTLLAECTEDDEVRTFLRQMASDEAAHKARIEQLATEATDRPLPNIPDDNVELVETRAEWSESTRLELDEAVRMAIEAEEFAALYYDAIASSCGDDKLREVFLTLAATEERHAERLRAMARR